MVRAGSAAIGLERGGHSFEPAKCAVSKSGLVLKRENHPFKNNITAEPPRLSASSHGSILEFIPFKISIPPTLVPIKEVVSRSQIADSPVVTKLLLFQ